MWKFDRKALIAARKAKGWSAGQLADRAGISARAVSKYEAGTSIAMDASAKHVAQALEIPLETLARRALRTAPARVPTAPIREPAPTPRSRVMSPLETLVQFERNAKRSKPAGDPPMLTATVFQHVMASPAIRDGHCYRVRGRPRAERGLSPPEWTALKTTRNLSARFEIAHELATGHELAVTVYAVTAPVIAALQAGMEDDERLVTLVVRVVLTTDPSEFNGTPPTAAFRLFGSDVFHGWGFVAESIEESRQGRGKGKKRV